MEVRDRSERFRLLLYKATAVGSGEAYRCRFLAISLSGKCLDFARFLVTAYLFFLTVSFLSLLVGSSSSAGVFLELVLEPYQPYQPYL